MGVTGPTLPQPTSALGLAAMSNQTKARLIWTEARANMSNRLWQAALGYKPAGDQPARPPGTPSGVQDLIATLVQETAVADRKMATRAAEPKTAASIADMGDLSGLGPNERHRGAIERAAARTSLPGTALASIINAEAGKLKNGAWNSFSRNPRSSAAGLGQFLSGTWVDMAEKRGTWLNTQARQRGYLGPSGKIQAGSRAAVLAMRYDSEASIHTIADYSRINIDRLKAAGIPVGNTAKDIGRSAYMAHYMGPGDAIRFMKGQLSEGRSRLLLNAQVGAGDAGRRIARSGGAVAAHSQWLHGHIDRNLRLARIPSARNA